MTTSPDTPGYETELYGLVAAAVESHDTRKAYDRIRAAFQQVALEFQYIAPTAPEED